MGSLVRLLVSLVVGIIVLAALVVFVILPPRVDRSMNAVVEHSPWPVSEEAAALHETLLVADLHADTFLWMRDPLKRHDRGHVDLPRMREGGMFFQLFTAVTKAPKDMNLQENSAGSDQITLLAIAQRWPMGSWGSLLERARYQAGRLRQMAERDDGVHLILTAQDLAAAFEARKIDPDVIAAMLGTEGSHPLEGELANIDVLYTDGYRVMGLQHFFDNEIGGSLHGVTKGGLTDFGRDAVARMEELGIVIDVAHSSEQVVRDVLAMAKRPIILSHTGFQGSCESMRNISDELMAEIAVRGGIIGVGFWDEAVCDASPDGVAAMVKFGIDTFGEDAIALGGDYDGTVTTYFDVSEMAALTDALMRAGLTNAQIAKAMGGNQLRFFLEYLPQGTE